MRFALAVIVALSSSIFAVLADVTPQCQCDVVSDMRDVVWEMRNVVSDMRNVVWDARTMHHKECPNSPSGQYRFQNSLHFPDPWELGYTASTTATHAGSPPPTPRRGC